MNVCKAKQQNHLPLYLIALFVWLVGALPVMAQQTQNKKTTISGTIINRNKIPVPGASVTLYKLSDRKEIGKSLSDKQGAFRFSVPSGKYYLRTTAISYESETINDIAVFSKNITLPSIILRPGIQKLDEVVITETKGRMELSLDKKIYHVGQDLANAGGTASDLLRNVPSVSVDGEGNISLRGSNSVRILIDGRPSGLVSFKGGSGLQQLQGSNVERIEVITNPSARYEAEGQGGVINIVLKKEVKQGINASVDVITGYPENFGGAANINYRLPKMNFFINYTGIYRRSPSRGNQYQEIYRNDSTFITKQSTKGRIKDFNHSIQGGIDYYFNEQSILTGAFTYRGNRAKRFTDIEYQDYERDLSNPISLSRRNQRETESEPNAEYSLTYKKQFKRVGQEFIADVRLLDNSETSDQYFTEQVFDATGSQPSGAAILQYSPSHETEKQFVVQADYTHPFSEKGKMEFGIRNGNRKMRNLYALSQQAADGSWFPIEGFNNNFHYDENISALYGIISNQIGKIDYQLGIRLERTDVRTALIQTGDENPRDYLNFFPSMHFTYRVDKKNAFQANYSRRVERPTYRSLNPFVTFVDNRNFRSGNPDLNPEFTNVFELGHVRYLDKGLLSSSIYYRRTSDVMLDIRRVNDDGFAVTRPENLATENAYGAEFVWTYGFYKWWNLDANINIYRSTVNGENLDATFTNKANSWTARLTNAFTVAQMQIQLRGNYESPQATPQGRQKAMGSLDISVSRDILKGRGTLVLNALDVFNTRRFRSITSGDNFYTENSFQRRMRQINLTFSYRFNQAKKAVNKDLIEDEAN
jgi:ferric enterobactin receptor